MQFRQLLSIILTLALLSSCATYDTIVNNDSSKLSDGEVIHSFYLVGDAGNADMNQELPIWSALNNQSQKASEKSTLIFLGDNVYEKGIPSKNDPERTLAEHRLNSQVEIANGFAGRTIFIPGNHDWYSGLSGLKDQEKLVEKALGKNTFLPENGCPIENIHVTDDIELILIDSQWFITNWDKHPTINDDCDIKTRQRFFDEFSSLIKKSRGKTTLVAIHHPMFTNGSHGGQYSFKSHMFPLPVLGTLKNVIRTTSGIANVDISNPHYNELRNRLITLSQANDKVVFVSGHDHNLQYIVNDNVHQIVSGSGSKNTAVRQVGGSQFVSSQTGYARVDIFKDGSSNVEFVNTDNASLYKTALFSPNEKPNITNYPSQFPASVKASVYAKDETEKSGTHKFLFGERFRDLYSTEVEAPTVNLDTLFGGLKPVRKGGGNQSKSLRLEDSQGTQYVMRALRKNATQYLQAILFKDQYIEGKFDNTAVEDLLLDVFAGSHPYAPFVVGKLADGAEVYHTNPVLYYVPKQNALLGFNEEFGNELYMIEEHTSEGHSDQASFGFQDKLISTEDMMKRIHKDEDIVIDEEAYIRARLFDMLIGDWDRHQDQWRWIEFKENGRKVYRPMPRDRDQAFSKMSDGFLLGAAVKFIPTARLLRKYSEDLEDVKGVNVEPYPLDMELIQQSDKSVWDAQVKKIQQGVTDQIIEEAFELFPKEIREQSSQAIKPLLQARRANLQKISDRYFDLVNQYAVIKGTNKDDWFDVERLPNGKTKVTAFRIKDGDKADIFHERTYNALETKEIWVYGLDDDDVFDVSGEGDKPIKVRLIGGQNNDIYDIKNGARVTFYDYKSKPNTVKTNKGKKKFHDNYNTNVYDYKKLKNNTNQFIPTLGANPDDGFRIGVSNTFTGYGFERNPFTAQHVVAASYYFATQGFDLNYKGEFANIFNKVNLGIEAQFNSPNFAVNFFGFGNETPNPEADEDDGMDVDLDFNRVKIRTFRASPSLIWRGRSGSSFKLAVSYESNEVERTENRFIEIFPEDNAVFDKQDFYGAEVSYEFANKDNDAFPTLGMQFNVIAGYKNNVSTEKGFAYVIPELGFDYKLVPSGSVVLATDLIGHFNLGNDFEFYQGATLGANNGLRGYRFQRFTGKSAFAQSTDVRVNLTEFKTGVLPLSLGFYGGFDYGRVWLENDDSDQWNTSVGGGVFLSLANMITTNISAFNSDDGLRLAFRLGFGF